ncbi:MAG: glycosyltransferase family 2 protein [Methanomicrobiales archaeon]|nr:glycosyltransferase family 2 protein [Methanomicrobiales archaeon]
MSEVSMANNHFSSQSLVGVLILNYNNLSDTVETLRSVQSLNYENLKILLVENSTDKEVIERLRAQFPTIQIIENEKNLGYAGGNNIGIQYLLDNGSDYILLLNNDVVLEQDALRRLIEAMDKDSSCATCQPLVHYYDDRETVWSAGTQMFLGYPRLYLKNQKDNIHGVFEPPFGLVGCCLLMRVSAIRNVGLFDESLFLMHEETDWCIRAKAAGYHLLVVADAHVRHKVSATLGSLSKEYLYYVGRNWLLLGRKHFSAFAYLIILLTEIFIRFPYYAYQLSKINRFNMTKYYLQGLIDGILGRSGYKSLI